LKKLQIGVPVEQIGGTLERFDVLCCDNSRRTYPSQPLCGYARTLA
jgi:hypothetical protein